MVMITGRGTPTKKNIVAAISGLIKQNKKGGSELEIYTDAIANFNGELSKYKEMLLAEIPLPTNRSSTFFMATVYLDAKGEYHIKKSGSILDHLDCIELIRESQNNKMP